MIHEIKAWCHGIPFMVFWTFFKTSADHSNSWLFELQFWKVPKLQNDLYSDFFHFFAWFQRILKVWTFEYQTVEKSLAHFLFKRFGSSFKMANFTKIVKNRKIHHFQRAAKSFKQKMRQRFFYTLKLKGSNFQNPLKPCKKVEEIGLEVILKFWKFQKLKLKKSAVAVISWCVEKCSKCHEWNPMTLGLDLMYHK